jgi:pSer/pThr/pTyr-binding forkhead associated (FHA) protein
MGHTSTFEAAKPNAPRALISVQVPGRAPWRVASNSGRLRVGRALDNDLVLSDDRVSRYHGQISVRFGTLVYADLGSTNGSFVNGARVSEIALGAGDVLQVGGSALTVEPGQ